MATCFQGLVFWKDAVIVKLEVEQPADSYLGRNKAEIKEIYQQYVYCLMYISAIRILGCYICE